MRIGIRSLLLLILLSSLLISTGHSDVKLLPPDVVYVASRPISYVGSLGQISFDLTVTLECVVSYSCTVDGVLPPTSTCHLNATPRSATLTVDYDIDRPFLPNLVGQKSVPLPVEELSGLVGDSPPIPIPIPPAEPVGTITIVIHGTLVGDLTPDSGVVNPPSVEWSDWTPQQTLLSTDVATAELTIETAYNVYFTATVSIAGFDVANKDSPTVGEFPGEPSPMFIIPEYPSILILSVSLLTALLAAVVYRRKTL